MNMSKVMQMIKMWKREDEVNRYEVGFRSWFNNRMFVVLMMIQRVRRKDAKVIAGAVQFLHDLEHHYFSSNQSKNLRNALEYLRLYFSVYPEVKEKNSRKAFIMIQRIYDELGMELGRSFYLTEHKKAEDKL